MTKKHVIIGTLLSMLTFGLIGWMVEGIAGMKLAAGIAVMFGMTAYVIAYALTELEQLSQNQNKPLGE